MVPARAHTSRRCGPVNTLLALLQGELISRGLFELRKRSRHAARTNASQIGVARGSSRVLRLDRCIGLLRLVEITCGRSRAGGDVSGGLLLSFLERCDLCIGRSLSGLLSRTSLKDIEEPDWSILQLYLTSELAVQPNSCR